MMGERNKHNLSRYVPSGVRAAVRQRCGFGCVVCGAAWYDYEHFDPDFKDAFNHNPDGITLLCMQHNQRRARGTLSAETVKKANDDPICLRDGFSSETFDLSTDPVEIVIGSARFINCMELITVNDLAILSVKPPLQDGQPFRVSGIFSDKDGLTTLRVEDNVFKVGADNWDVECVGPRIIVKKSKDDISLILKCEPPNKIVIEKIHMEFEGAVIKGDLDVIIVSPNGHECNRLQNVVLENSPRGIVIYNRFYRRI